MKIRVPALILAVPALAACGGSNDTKGKYSLERIDSSVYLVDSKDGTVYIREGYQFVPIERLAGTDDNQLASAISLSPEPVKGLSVDVKAKMLGGEMQWIAQVKPATEPAESSDTSAPEKPVDPDWREYWEGGNNRLIVHFEDDEGFSIHEQTIVLSGQYADTATSMVNADGAVGAFEYSGEANLSHAEFAQISRADVSYNLEYPDE